MDAITADLMAYCYTLLENYMLHFFGIVKDQTILFQTVMEIVFVHRHEARFAAGGLACFAGVSFVEAPSSVCGVWLGLSICPALSFAR